MNQKCPIMLVDKTKGELDGIRKLVEEIPIPRVLVSRDHSASAIFRESF